MRKKIWIVDDDGNFLQIFQKNFPNEEVVYFKSGKELFKALESETPDYIFVDLSFDTLPEEELISRIPQEEGLAIVKRLKNLYPGLKIMLVSRFGDQNIIMQAKKLKTPFLDSYSSDNMVKDAILKFFGKRSGKGTSKIDFKLLREKLEESGFYTVSQEVLKEISSIPLNPQNKGPILILGPTGVGKTKLAEVLHKLMRPSKPFKVISPIKTAPDVLPSELFGHEKGSFTGAIETKKGIFELANGGTVFLDEIGELNSELQAKFLTFLDHRKVRRIGGSKEIPVDVLIIAATSRDPSQYLREDLFWRFVYRITLPPLEQRREDIEYYLKEAAPKIFGVSFTPSAIEFLKNLTYPGNFRSINILLNYLAFHYPNEKIGIDILYQEEETIRKVEEGRFSGSPTQRALMEEIIEHLQKTNIGIKELESQLIDYLLMQGKKPHEVASILKISTPSVYRKKRELSK